MTDWESVHRWASLEEVSRYQEWGPNTAEQTRAFLRQATEAWAAEPRTWVVHAVLLAGAVIGTAELNPRIRDGWRDSDVHSVLENEWQGGRTPS